MIVLVNPNLASVYSEYKHSPSQFPIGLAYVASSLEYLAEDVMIIDGAAENLSPEAIAKRIPQYCDWVGITVTTPLYKECVRIAKAIKERIDVKIVVGGNHITALYNEIDEPCFDCLVAGEIEGMLPEMLREDFSRRIYNCPTPTNMDIIDWPARDLFSYYADPRLNSEKTTSIITSRGCVGKCKYCVAGNKKNIRLRSIENIAGELKNIKWSGFKYLNIEDDNFIINKKRTIEICEVIKQLDFKYAAMAIAKFVDKDVVKALADSGCQWLCYGIESGCDDILKDMGRLSTNDEVRNAVQLTKDAGIKVRGTYMLGWVGETESQMYQTLDFIREIKADENAVSIVTPYPGTALWDRFVSGRSVDFDRFCYYNKVGFNLSTVPDKRLLEIEQEAFQIINEYQLH